MTTEDISGWLAVVAAALPPAKVVSLWQAMSSADAILAASPRDLSSAGLTPAEQARLAAAARKDYSSDLKLLERLNVSLVTLADFDYPSNLRQLPDHPAVLFVRGKFEAQDARAVALVGTRNASPYGRTAAQSLARDLARNGVTVVSGLARGIDSCAHEGALEAQGRTIGVMACGIDVPYPRESQPLVRRIVEGGAGAVISEFPPGFPPMARNFVQRNRLISGLALGVVVIEAPEKSGAIITANWAAEQDRQVFAVPGSINSLYSRGCHALIRDGAAVCTGVGDILEELNLPVVAEHEEPKRPQLTGEEEKLLSLLSLEQKNVEELIQSTSFSSAQVASTLMVMELKGLVRRLPGNYFVRVR
jgi:DNA processing protein